MGSMPNKRGHPGGIMDRAIMDPIDALLALPRFGAGIGLHRMRAGLERVDSAWWAGLDAIKVTGSNGKGSTCALVAGILEAHGLRVGLYTSPHLWRVHERIRVQGEPIDPDELRRSVRWVLDIIAEQRRDHPEDQFSAFEAFTLAAMHHFARVEVDVVVAEAGIGGRYDPTRAIPGRTCGLVSVDLEHTALLGETEEAIAYDKADLCPSGGELVVGPLAPELMRRLDAYARLRGVTLLPVSRVERRVIGPGSRGPRVHLAHDDVVIDDVSLPAPGDHQLDNAAVALVLVEHWLRRRLPGISADARGAAVHRGMQSVHLPGRLERVHDEPPVWIDVGHTPAALDGVAQWLDARPDPAPVLLLTGVSADRDPAILTPLLQRAAQVVCTRSRERGGDPARVIALVERVRPDLGQASEAPPPPFPTVSQALIHALEVSRARDMMVLVAGSLFIAAEAAHWLREHDL